MADKPLPASAPGGGQRVDRWLFFARVAKSRTLAQKLVQSGAVRINREKTDNAARIVRPGDVLTLSLGGRVRVLKVLDPGTRRGPASEAATLYQDMTTPAEGAAATGSGTADGSGGSAASGLAANVPAPAPEGRPSKHDRKALQKLKGGPFG
ncbi:RNA-binding S4 domain-containing protein [Jiella sp. M17.18]|uniref:RNA-binding S4 domain-containing protein n=1 Tax=Jiella sp. M17.18 TaxID=3234247 RepID=UPI0034DE24C6